ncbi:MAG: hypothetical protein FWD44_03660 [Oscillospiraceae bacterium]|nr:hypothetical protein [Oscillospiraceae bacterium]
MKRPDIFKKNAWDILKGAVLPVLFTLAVVLMIVYAINETGESSKQEGARILEDSIRRAVITAYALEGLYPSTIEHIEQNFGVFIDRERFIVHYMAFGSNMMPDIVVISR